MAWWKSLSCISCLQRCKPVMHWGCGRYVSPIRLACGGSSQCALSAHTMPWSECARLVCKVDNCALQPACGCSVRFAGERALQKAKHCWGVRKEEQGNGEVI